MGQMENCWTARKTKSGGKTHENYPAPSSPYTAASTSEALSNRWQSRRTSPWLLPATWVPWGRAASITAGRGWPWAAFSTLWPETSRPLHSLLEAFFPLLWAVVTGNKFGRQWPPLTLEHRMGWGGWGSLNLMIISTGSKVMESGLYPVGVLTTTCPELGRRSPVSILKVVVFPAPFTPRSPKHWKQKRNRP